MNDFFEFGKHRLSEQGAAQIVDFAVDDVSAHLRIARGLKQMMRKQFLVEGGCDLREKDRILVILKELGTLREPTVHRVTSLVRERVHIREYVLLVIHQNVRRRAITTGGKCAAAFAFVFVTIAPASRAQTFCQHLDIFLS